MNWINKQNDRDMSPSSFNLQEIIETYGENSEIFQLILISKVEEDRRRIEEAKLKQKKIDFFVSNKDNAKKKIKRNDNKPRVLGLSREEFYKDVDHSSSTAYSVKQNETTLLQPKRHKSLTQLFSPSSLAICSPLQDKSVDSHNFQQELQSSVALPINRRNSVDGSSNRASDTLPPIASVTTRRRREMQPITMIIETKEFPYNDDYVWKNNGNTTHKSTGQKSIYYKCSNSNAGCSVNKTVSFRSNGEYLIKYRGFHLHECCKIKRVMAM
ncbi:uncharacterized protein EV154DRAFT_413289 [Mucor mucedo]|uniref:uncharacterized protein n=1 Tax=Mucor mucedo TaxID=29922 RepID=UPI00221E727F|nr:uncharacterized protein EV154DRAFT_413289 [Mucor mucedo]KAI7895575.1 hypothetical protein EV154DRAFT_413289 [Mucor mucedo]